MFSWVMRPDSRAIESNLSTLWLRMEVASASELGLLVGGTLTDIVFIFVFLIPPSDSGCPVLSPGILSFLTPVLKSYAYVYSCIFWIVTLDIQPQTLIPSKQISRINLILNVIKHSIISISYYGICSCLELLNIVHNETTKECGAIFYRWLINNNCGSLGL